MLSYLRENNQPGVKYAKLIGEKTSDRVTAKERRSFPCGLR
jgi:hypothetical protein